MIRPTLLGIATTLGPSVVRAMTFDPAAARSQIVRFEQSHIPAGVDAHFFGFDQKLRSQLRVLGFSIPTDPLILEVDADIDTGSSWQLGLAAAHILYAESRLTFDEENCDRRLLVTGRLGTSVWDVKSIEGLTEKLAHATAFFDGVPVDSARFLVPAGNMESSDFSAGRITVNGVRQLGELVEFVGVQARPTPSGVRFLPVFKTILGLTTAIGVVGLWLLFDGFFGIPDLPVTSDRTAEVSVGQPMAPGPVVSVADPSVSSTQTAETSAEQPVVPQPVLAAENPSVVSTEGGEIQAEQLVVTDPVVAAAPLDQLPRLEVLKKIYLGPGGCQAVFAATALGDRQLAWTLTPIPFDATEVRGGFNTQICGLIVTLVPGASSAGALLDVEFAEQLPGIEVVRKTNQQIEVSFRSDRLPSVFEMNVNVTWDLLRDPNVRKEMNFVYVISP